MSAAEKLLGPTLVLGGKEIPLAAHLGSAKYLGLYFSAHWCPPCRGFTPQLAKFYKDDLKKKGLEIIFVSSDRDEEAFKEYAAEQPWAALPFADRARKAKLSAKYGVQGIPTLVVLDASTGDVVTKDGRAAVMKDPSGASMPWTPPNPLDILRGAPLVDHHMNKADFAQLAGGAQVVGLYFSAHWCGPCKAFTPKLAALYSKLKAEDEKAGRPPRFAVVFVSSDRDDQSFRHYLETMPWHAIGERAGEASDALSELFGVEGIPTLVLLDKSGKLLSAEGVGSVAADPEGADFPWTPKPVNVLSQATARLVKGPAVVVFCDDDAGAKALQSALEPQVVKWQGGEIEGAADLDFFTAGAKDPVVLRVKELLGPVNGKATHLVLDLSSGGCFVPRAALEAGKRVSVDDVRALVVDHLASKIAPSALVRG